MVQQIERVLRRKQVPGLGHELNVGQRLFADMRNLLGQGAQNLVPTRFADGRAIPALEVMID